LAFAIWSKKFSAALFCWRLRREVAIVPKLHLSGKNPVGGVVAPVTAW